MTIDEFCSLREEIFHVTTADAVQQIRRHGLLSTAAILDLCAVEGNRSDKLFSMQRISSELIHHPLHGSFMLRDQKPLPQTQLEKCLTDIRPTKWYELINSRVFFWVQKKRMENLRSASHYHNFEQKVLTFNARSLLSAHFDRVFVSFFNTGYALRKPVARGTNTFVPLIDCPRRELSKVVELTIEGGVADVEQFLAKH